MTKTLTIDALVSTAERTANTPTLLALYAIRKEMRRLVDLLDGECTLPDGSNADTLHAHALLGDFAPCTLCGEPTSGAGCVTGQASGPNGVILRDGEVAHAGCLEDVRGY